VNQGLGSWGLRVGLEKAGLKGRKIIKRTAHRPSPPVAIGLKTIRKRKKLSREEGELTLSPTERHQRRKMAPRPLAAVMTDGMLLRESSEKERGASFWGGVWFKLGGLPGIGVEKDQGRSRLP